MDPRWRAFLRLTLLLLVVVVLFLLFPVAFQFAEGAARSVVRLWWLVLLAALGLWLIWGVGRRPK
jgi:predicted ABC-type exoprotein transport system permease subunit